MCVCVSVRLLETGCLLVPRHLVIARALHVWCLWWAMHPLPRAGSGPHLVPLRGPCLWHNFPWNPWSGPSSANDEANAKLAGMKLADLGSDDEDERIASCVEVDLLLGERTKVTPSNDDTDLDADTLPMGTSFARGAACVAVVSPHTKQLLGAGCDKACRQARFAWQDGWESRTGRGIQGPEIAKWLKTAVSQRCGASLFTLGA